MSLADNDHAFKDDDFTGCTTESLGWDRPDYDETAGFILFRLHESESKHLVFVDVLVKTNDGREILLDRVEEGKITSSLRDIRNRVQDAREDTGYDFGLDN